MIDKKRFNDFYDRVTQPGMEERWLKEFLLPWCRLQRAGLHDFAPVYEASEGGKHKTFASFLNHVSEITGQGPSPEPMEKDAFYRCIHAMVILTHRREASVGVGVEDLWAWGKPKEQEHVTEVAIGKPSPDGEGEGPSPSAGEDLQP